MQSISIFLLKSMALFQYLLLVNITGALPTELMEEKEMEEMKKVSSNALFEGDVFKFAHSTLYNEDANTAFKNYGLPEEVATTVFEAAGFFVVEGELFVKKGTIGEVIYAHNNELTVRVTGALTLTLVFNGAFEVYIPN